MLRGEFGPGFYVKHFIKDMRIARDEAATMGIHLPGLCLVLGLFEELERRGGSDQGIHALYLLYKDGAVPAV